ncbi:MAG: hypothetical protein K2O34_12325 [Acetatifactor sp.]|nr:hypothetical protein [Acetatifactor sp.]
MNENICRIVKIEKEALYEFIYENFVAQQENIMDVDSLEVMNTFTIDWDKGQFIFCAHKCEDELGNIVPFPSDIDLRRLLQKLPPTANSVLREAPYKDYTFDELRALSESNYSPCSTRNKL